MASTSPECLTPGRTVVSPGAYLLALHESRGMHKHLPASRQRWLLPAAEARSSGFFLEFGEATIVADPDSSSSHFAVEGVEEAFRGASTPRSYSRRVSCSDFSGGHEGGAGAFTAGLGAADVAAAASPDSGLGSPGAAGAGHRELVLGHLDAASRRVGRAGGPQKASQEGGGTKLERRDPALEAALEQRRERRGQRRLDRMVRRMGLLERSCRSQSDGNFDWLKREDLEVGEAGVQGEGLGPGVVGSSCVGGGVVDGGLVLSGPERLLPESRP